MAEKRVLSKSGQAISTLRSTLTGYRNAIRVAFGDHASLRFMRLSLEDMEELRQGYRETILRNHESLRPVNCEALVAIATDVVTRAPREQPENSTGEMLVAAALCLLTGRRVTEVLKTATFAPGKKRGTLVFSGQLKRGEADVIDDVPYIIPVLANRDLILEAVAVLRHRVDCTRLSNDGVNDRWSKYIGRATKTLFADANGKTLTPKDLRAIYALTGYAWFAPDSISMNAYFANILGHAATDLNTSLSYVKFYPLGEKRAFDSDLAWSIDAAIALQEDALEDETDETKRGYIRERIETLRKIAE